MTRVYLVGCVLLSILLISSVTTWAGSCPEGQKWHDAWRECVKDRTSLGKKKSGKIRSLSGFLTSNPSVQPIRNTNYADVIPELKLESPEVSTVIIYSHGTTMAYRKEDCRKWWNAVPKSLSALEKNTNTYIYYLCSVATEPRGQPAQGAYIFKRIKEIDSVLDSFLDLGVLPKNIFLSGYSAGGWASLMLMSQISGKFNAVVAFAPAFAGKRSEIHQYPVWRKEIRPRQVKQMISNNEIEALIFAYKNDAYNRPQELQFLIEAFPNTVQLIGYKCDVSLGKTGHTTHINDCQRSKTSDLIRNYLEDRKSSFSANE